MHEASVRVCQWDREEHEIENLIACRNLIFLGRAIKQPNKWFITILFLKFAWKSSQVCDLIARWKGKRLLFSIILSPFFFSSHSLRWLLLFFFRGFPLLFISLWISFSATCLLDVATSIPLFFSFSILISFSINDWCQCMSMCYECVSAVLTKRLIRHRVAQAHTHCLWGWRKEKCAHSVCHGKLNWSEYKSAANRQKTPEWQKKRCKLSPIINSSFS